MRISVAFLLATASSIRLSPADAATAVVVPNNSAEIEGDISNVAPFTDAGTNRYQQVYAASQFAAVQPGGALITEIAFRPNWQFAAPGPFVVADVQIELSTTDKPPHMLDGVFANNVGADNTVVFGPGTLMLSTLHAGPARGPKAFDILIPLTTPFFYDPAHGNLLLDVRKFTQTSLFDNRPAFDAIEGDPTTSRLHNHNPNDPNAVAAAGRDYGLITRFTFVPEPSAASLLLISLLGLRRRLHADFGERQIARLDAEPMHDADAVANQHGEPAIVGVPKGVAFRAVERRANAKTEASVLVMLWPRWGWRQ